MSQTLKNKENIFHLLAFVNDLFQTRGDCRAPFEIILNNF